jgi:hypothetical protein
VIPISLDGLDHYAWPYEPEWGKGVRVIFSVEADQVDSLTKRENRRAYGESLRISEIDATYLVDGPSAAEIRNAARILQDTPVRLPFLPGIDDVATFGARWYLAFDDGAQNLYWTDSPLDLSGRQHIIPTLLGYLADPPRFDLLDTNDFLVSLRWHESSENGERLQLQEQTWDEGPAIGARTIYEFPFFPDFVSGQDAGPVVVDVERKTLGFSRDSSSAAYPQLGYRNPTFAYSLFDQVDKLLRFFLDRKGSVEPFWLPGLVEECRLAADAGPADTTITVSNAAAIGDQRYVMLFSDTTVMRKITSITGNVLTLDSALGEAFTAENTVLCTLALVRFASNQLTVDWTAPQVASAKIAFQEVSQEYFTPAGETYGQTIGVLPAKCFLFELRHGDEVWYWTSYEKDLNFGGNTYLAAPIDFNEIVDGLAWANSSCKLQMRSSWKRVVTGFIVDPLGDYLVDPVTGGKIIAL